MSTCKKSVQDSSEWIVQEVLEGIFCLERIGELSAEQKAMFLGILNKCADAKDARERKAGQPANAKRWLRQLRQKKEKDKEMRTKILKQIVKHHVLMHVRYGADQDARSFKPEWIMDELDSRGLTENLGASIEAIRFLFDDYLSRQEEDPDSLFLLVPECTAEEVRKMGVRDSLTGKIYNPIIPSQDWEFAAVPRPLPGNPRNGESRAAYRLLPPDWADVRCEFFRIQLDAFLEKAESKATSGWLDNECYLDTDYKIVGYWVAHEDGVGGNFDGTRY